MTEYKKKRLALAVEYREKLQVEYDAWQASGEQLRQDLKAATADVKRYGGEQPEKSGKKPSAAREVIMGAAVELINENHPQSVNLGDLKAMVVERLAGYSLTGRLRHFEKWLADTPELAERSEGEWGMVSQ